MRRDWRNVHAGKRGVGGAERGFILVHNGEDVRECSEARRESNYGLFMVHCVGWGGSLEPPR